MDFGYSPYSSNVFGGFKAPNYTEQKKTIPQQQTKQYTIQGTIIPGVDDVRAKSIVEGTSKIADPVEKQAVYNLAVQEAMKNAQAEQFSKEKETAKADLMSEWLNTKDDVKRAQLGTTVKLANISDMLRTYATSNGVSKADVVNMKDADLIGKYLDTTPEAQQPFMDYMGGKKDQISFGRELGLIKEEEQPVKEPVDSNVFTDVVAGSLASTTGLPRFVANKTAEGIGWAAKQLGADEATVNNLVESYKQSISEEQLAKEMGADTESMSFQGTKMAGDVIQSAIPGGIIRGATKGTMLASKIDKLPLVGRIAKGALEGLGESALYNIISEQKVGEPINLGVGAGIGAVIPAGGALLGAVGKKIAPSLEVSGLFAGGKLEKIRNTIIEEGIEGAGKNEKSDLGKWMLDRGFKGSKAEIATQTAEHAKKSKQMVDEILSESTTRIKSDETTNVLNDLVEQTSKTPGLEQESSLIQGMISKDGKYTLSELNQAKRLMDEYYNIYKQSGDVGSSLKAKGLDNIRKTIRKTIEDVSDAEADQLGIAQGSIKKLNNETQVATAISKEVSRREALDTAREMVSFLAGRSPGAIAGGLVGGYAGGGDWKDVVIGTILGSLATNTSLKTKVATMLNKLSGEEIKSLQRFIKTKVPSDLPVNVANKIEDIRLNVLPDNQAKNVGGDMNNMNTILSTNGESNGLKPKTSDISIRKPVVTMKTPEEPLMVEARKYKSAEEFVKAQGESTYHGSSTKREGQFNKPKEGVAGSEAIFVSPDEAGANYYNRGNGDVKKTFIDKNSRIFDYSNRKDIESISKFIKEDKLFNKYLKDNEYVISKEDIIKQIEKGSYSWIQKPPVIKELKKLGYDGFKNIDWYEGGAGESIGIFSPDKIKTESQLKQIREEANKSK